MKAKVRVNPPEPPGWVYEPKWDGFRAVEWSGETPRMESRNGKDLLRYFPELRPALAQLAPGTVLDGEVVVVVNDVTEFDTLQMRIHPAESRITRLAEETPAELVAFDLLALRSEDLRPVPYGERRAALETLFAELEFPWHLTPVTEDLGEATQIGQRLKPADPGRLLDALGEVFDYAAREVRYVSINMGIGKGAGYLPATPAAVCKNRYGDCKDKSFLIRGLTSSWGVETHPVLVRTHELGPMRDEVPSPGQFNHCIAAVALPSSTRAVFVSTLMLAPSPTATFSSSWRGGSRPRNDEPRRSVR